MENTAANPTTVAMLVGKQVVDASGRSLGRVQELAVDVGRDSNRVSGLLLSKGGHGKARRSMVAVADLQKPLASDKRLRTTSEPHPVPALSDTLLLERDLLDQQIIDVHGHKVVRVNDVNLAWAEDGPEGHTTSLLIQDVEIGMRGAARRLLKGLPAGTVDGIVSRFRRSVIPWSFVDLIDRDPARRVRLKIEQERLAKLHPSDIADILEELAPAEREAVFICLPEETAAEALEEIEPQDAEGAPRIASTPSRSPASSRRWIPAPPPTSSPSSATSESEAILEEMEPEERQDVEELLEFSANSAAGRMTTEYVSVSRDATVDRSHRSASSVRRRHRHHHRNLPARRREAPRRRRHAAASAPCRSRTQALLALRGPHRLLRHARHGRKVAELFDKYNLRSLPVRRTRRATSSASFTPSRSSRSCVRADAA